MTPAEVRKPLGVDGTFEIPNVSLITSGFDPRKQVHPLGACKRINGKILHDTEKRLIYSENVAKYK